MQRIHLIDQERPAADTSVDTSSHNSRSTGDAGKPILATIPDLSREVGIPPSSMYELCNAGVPGAFKRGTRWLIHREIFLAHLERLAREGGQL